MNVKLSDIARITGFSINTVSRALRGDSRISGQTSRLICSKAEELGYIRNEVAGSMRSSRTNTIGVVSADSSNPFFAEVLLGIEDAARKMNYSILLINTEEQAENEYDAVKLLIGRQVDGLIIIPVFDDPKNLSMYELLGIPYIFAGRRVKGLEAHSILHGDEEGSSEVFSYLLETGHKRIFYLAGPGRISNSVDRLEGMKRAFREKGRAFDADLVVETRGHIDDGYSEMNRALNKGLEFTAVACFNDLVAMGVLKSLHENGLCVPEDIEVFGYDNLNMAQYMQPRLSSVDVPKARLGQAAVEELMLHIEDGNRPYNTLEMKPRLVFRETTKR